MTGVWIVLPLLLAQSASSLETRVSAYWEALSKRDKAAAIEFVAGQSRNAFIQRREPIIQSWKLAGIDRKSPSEAVATVELMRSIPGVPGFHPLRVVETWELEDGQWRVRVRGATPQETLGQFRNGGEASRPPVAGELKAVPQTLRIHFLSQSQTGAVRLANGLGVPVEVEQVDFDSTLFRLKTSPTRVEPSAFGAFVLQYIGSEISKDLRSQLRIVTRVQGRERVFEVPIVYNYLSPAARALFGLSPEAAEKLKRGEKLTPALPRPPG